MKLIIKKFDELTPNELYEILKIRAEVFVVDQKCAYQDLDSLDYKCYHHYLEKDGEILAYTRIFDKGMNFPEASFGRVLSNKNYRSKGFCKKLLKESIKFIEYNLKENIIKIKAQSHAVNFYKKLGFYEDGEEYMEEFVGIKFPHVNMVYKS